MTARRWITIAGGASAIFGMIALSAPAAWAQDATPEAVEASVPRPVHIHSGNCTELGDVVVPLIDLVAPQGDRVGQGRRATLAETSYTQVPLTLDAILAADHAINVHLSTDEIETYIACGEIGGVLTPEGTLNIGLSEVGNSGFTGIAYLGPNADGASTDVSVFIADVSGRDRDRTADQDEQDSADIVATPIQ